MRNTKMPGDDFPINLLIVSIPKKVSTIAVVPGLGAPLGGNPY
jgi:hypothetical protein